MINNNKNINETTNQKNKYKYRFKQFKKIIKYTKFKYITRLIDLIIIQVIIK